MNLKQKPTQSELAILEDISLKLWILAVREYERKNNPRLLKKELEQAVACEDFERACVIRDLIASKTNS